MLARPRLPALLVAMTPTLACAMALLMPLAAEAESIGCGAELTVSSRVKDGQVVVSVLLATPAPAPVVWAVMTDYGHATQFIRHLTRSEAVRTTDNTLLVTQTGRVTWGPFKADVTTEYHVQLKPAELRLSGQLRQGDVKDMWLQAQLRTSGDRTELVYQNGITPAIWMPLSLAEPMLTKRAEESFVDLANEVARRAHTCDR